MQIFGREPALIIGTIVSIVLAVVRVLAGDELITPDVADQATNLTNKIGDLAILLLPLITSALIRPAVTSTAQPSLPLGTPVLIKGTGDTPPPDAVVAVRSR